MEKDNKEIIVLRTERTKVMLSVSIIGVFVITFIKDEQWPFLSEIPLIFKVSLFIFYLLVAFFWWNHSGIIIKSGKIFFPRPNPFSRAIVDIASIRKIIKYPSLADANHASDNDDGYYREIAITYLDAKISIRLAYSSWGSELINELIETILEQNENVQIVDYDRLFNEKKL